MALPTGPAKPQALVLRPAPSRERARARVWAAAARWRRRAKQAWRPLGAAPAAAASSERTMRCFRA